VRFKDKVAIVTGGSRGIGKAICSGFAEGGGQVVIFDLLEDEGKKTEEEIKSRGGKVLFIKTDVSKTKEVESAVKQCIDMFGKVDILINNAGWDRMMLFNDTDEDFWDKVIDINYKGVLRCCKAVLAPMVERKYGKIVSIGSDAGRVGSTGEAVYSGCKGAIISFTKTLARETARYGINVNCVCPGPTQTPGMEETKKEEFAARILGAMDKIIPMGKLGKPEDVAAAVLFLASDEASYITGQTLSVSGGLTMI